MSRLELINNSTLTQSQQETFDTIIKYIESKVSSFFFAGNNPLENMISLTGAAGTGKTYLTAQIVKYLLSKDSSDYNFVVTAPTHKATSVLSSFFSKMRLPVSARTIHSFLGIKPLRNYNTGEERFKLDNSKKILETTSILIIDESSLISSNLFDIILDAMERKVVNFVLFVGDAYQLAPINETQSVVYSLKNQIELKEVVRQQKDNDIIALANRLRDAIAHKTFGSLEEEFYAYLDSKNIEFFHNKKAFLEDFYSANEWYNQDRIVASYTNKNVDAFNKTIRNRYWQEKGKNNLPTLVAGDKVRFNKAYSIEDTTIYHNNLIVEIEEAKLKYHNQLEIEFWECKEVNSNEQQIFRVVEPNSAITFNKKLEKIKSLARIEKDKLKKRTLWKAYFQTRDMFADVQYIYSMTIHKLQGSTVEDIYVDMFSLLNNPYMSKEEQYRCAYVAITRASSKAKIFIPSPKKELENQVNINEEEAVNTKNKFKEIDNFLKDLL